MHKFSKGLLPIYLTESIQDNAVFPKKGENRITEWWVVLNKALHTYPYAGNINKGSPGSKVIYSKN